MSDYSDIKVSESFEFKIMESQTPEFKILERLNPEFRCTEIQKVSQKCIKANLRPNLRSGKLFNA